ncbi:MAG: CotH kinase family protein [Candidatus Bathyarchaeota archaeon]|nr:CotH kinase family protein [Candidatus Bathyarchaeota archaeon]
MITFLSLALLSATFVNIGLADTTPTKRWSGENQSIDEASVFFDDSYVHEIRLYFDDPNWYETLYAAHDKDRNTKDPYFPARFVSHGIEINRVGVRFKGFSTFGFGVEGWVKKSFRIDFNYYDNGTRPETTFLGLKKLDLNNLALDTTLMREKLFMDFARKYVPAPRSVYTRLYINDEYYGLYLAVEHIDNTFIETHFGDYKHGNIYKAEMLATLSYFGPDPELYYGFYELKNNEAINDWTDLIELTRTLTLTPLEELPAKLEPLMDVKSVLYTLALLDLFVSLDSYIGNARNYYLYRNGNTGKFTMLLWDANLAFGTFWIMMPRNVRDPARYDVFPPATLQPIRFEFIPGGNLSLPPPPPAISKIDPSALVNLVLIQRVLAVDSYKKIYLRALAQMLREGFDAETISARIQELASLIKEYVYSDPYLLTPVSMFEPSLKETISFVERRAAYLNSRLNQFAEKTDLKINELVTVNRGTAADNHGDYDPWVEIYNLGPGAVKTPSTLVKGGSVMDSRLFLTDDPSVPNKWELPQRSIEDGEFLVLWLDGEPNEGDDHAPFTLNPAGGNLYLYTNDFSGYILVDSVSYPNIEANISFGRYPDGEGSWRILKDGPTYAKPNLFVDPPPTGLVINEFMARNRRTLRGPDGTYPDWIELYNGGDTPVDLSGMYLTDNLNRPRRFRFPDGVVLGPGEFMVIWADASLDQTGIHTGFALKGDFEEIGLFARDGRTLIDSVVFGKQRPDVSYGRYPDGSPNWEYLIQPTPGKPNVKVTNVGKSSIWSITLLIGVAVAVCLPFIVKGKTEKKSGGRGEDAEQTPKA